MRLSPNNPQRYVMYIALAFAHFVSGRYAEALSFSEAADRIGPGFSFPACVIAASAALMGRTETAQKAMANLRQLDPDLRLSNLRRIQPIRRPEDFARWQEGLRLAGLPE